MQSSNHERTWFLRRGGQQYGPISDAEFSKLDQERHLQPNDLLWNPGQKNWVEYQELVRQTPRPQEHSANVEFVPRPQRQYRAFLSYSHADERWAKWLHARLERFKIDSDLVGRPSGLGIIPKSLRPIFRDRSDFVAGLQLSKQTAAALETSEALIVLCSPSSASSNHVNEEIRQFKQQTPRRHIIPVIVGELSDRADIECFPPALADVSAFSTGDVLLAADLRETRDGRTLGLAKIVASLLHLQVDDVFRRAERYRKRLRRVRNSIVVALLFLTAAATTSAFMFQAELRKNEALLDRTLERATTLLNKTVAMSEDYGLPRAVSLSLLGEAERMFTDMAELGVKSTKLTLRKTRMYIEFARTYEILGQSEVQLQRANEALALIEKLARDDPGNYEVQWLQMTALNEVGDALRIRGSLEQAYAKFVAAINIVRAMKPTVGTMDALRIGLERLGAIDALTGNTARALEAANHVLNLAQGLAQSDPTYKRAISKAHTNLGDLYIAIGQYHQALAHQKNALQMDRHLADVEPRKPSAQADLAVSYERVATLFGVNANFEAALEHYKASLNILQRLIETDPRNASWRMNECWTMAYIGDTYLGLGQFGNATNQYGAALVKVRPLARSDHGNVVWQFGLAANYFRLALASALASLPDARRAVEIAKALNSLKVLTKNEGIDLFRELTLSTFREATGSDAKVHLESSAEIVTPLIASNRLPPSTAKVAEIFSAANAALK